MDNIRIILPEYTYLDRNLTVYESEGKLEENFINQLKEQGYEYLKIDSSDMLKANLRKCLEELNNIIFTDSEWSRFFDNCIANSSEGIVEKTRKIQKDFIQVLEKDDGTCKNIKLIDKENLLKNKVQVINQFENNGNVQNRYDVTILVNGLPLVHCELKRRGVPIIEAFNQIDRYQRESFWSNLGLYEYVQIFVISNGTHTKYYSNTTRFDIVEKNQNKRKAIRTGLSPFEFTSYWADIKNKTIEDIQDFTKTFFDKNTLLQILTKYCILTEKKDLLVMRPYQIAATEEIYNKVLQSEKENFLGKKEAGGYIWHTTGSGKTLTSFKTSQLISKVDFVDKVIFVVDRQDLDYQTINEYNTFKEDAVNGNRNTEILAQQLEDKNVKIVVTTIQKLGNLIRKYKNHSIFNEKVVLIFDECHRSQFGILHKDITSAFKKYILFGFTGTPIFAKNAVQQTENNVSERTTEQIFGDRLHTYTIVNAIGDNNVLPFKIDYIKTIKDNNGDDSLIGNIDDEKILLAKDRVSNIVSYILQHYNQKTMRNGSSYMHNNIRRTGYNSIFAVSSIKAAKVYYTEFKKQIKENNSDLKVGLIYSYTINKEEDGNDCIIEEDSDSTKALDVADSAFLQNAIQDYNDYFKTNYDISGGLFQNYYKDISKNMKDGKIDILIVVNMFLTGFDSKILNTLWVDKNLKTHGLIQAFSRTNRIFNNQKSFGNIVCFRNLKKEVEDAVALFGDEGAKGIILLKSFMEYYNGYNDKDKYTDKITPNLGYKGLVNKLQTNYQLPLDLKTINDKKEFIKIFGNIIRLRNILKSFDEFTEEKELLKPGELQDYSSNYYDLYHKFKEENQNNKENVTSDIIFEMELVNQVIINIDYILKLVEKYHSENIDNKKISIEIIKLINSNPKLKSKRKLIEQFILNLDNRSNLNINKEWVKFKEEEREKELNKIIIEGYKGKSLKEKETRNLVNKLFKFNDINILEDEISSVLPSLSRFNNDYSQAKVEIEEKIKNLFLYYSD